MVKTEYYDKHLVEVDTKKVWGIFGEYNARVNKALSLFICVDCGYCEFRLDKEHLKKFKQYSLDKSITK
jgi:hypothetical protein